MSIDVAVASWFPLSAAQYSRWFLYQFDPIGRGNHNNVFVATLHGRIDVAVLQQAVNALVLRHPLLRARVRCLPGEEPQQCVVPQMQVALDVFDASGIDESALRERVSADAWRAFDLDHAPLLRAALYQRAADSAVFLFAFDHLICDGWSYWRLMEQLGAELAGVGVATPPVADYRDYVHWQREWLQSPKAQKQLAYWEKALGGDLPVLALPLDRPRPRHSSANQGVVSLALPAALTGRLAELAAQQQSSSYTVLLAAYQLLLHRYTGQGEVVVGSPLPGRSRDEWDDVVGDFVNIVALRADLSDDPSVADVLRRARGSVLRAVRNQDYPFSQLVDVLQRSPGAGEHPLFQTAFVFQNARHGRELGELWNSYKCGKAVARWGALELRPFPIPQRVANDRIALALHAIELEDHIRCDFCYDADVFDAATIERLGDCFVTLLDSMASDPLQPASRLSLLPTSQRRQVLVDFNATAQDVPHDALLHQAFERQAAAQPDAIALRCGDDALSYAELNRRANRLAHRLLAHGVKPDDRVGVCLERGAALVVGLLGVLKAGAAYVPLDPAYPAERLAGMLADSAPAALLARPATPLPAGAAALACIDPEDAALAALPGSDPDAAALGLRSSHLAYVIYTSGSTGRPKGVAIEHRNSVNLVAWAATAFSGEQLRDTLFSTSINFDLAVYELFVPLSLGHSLTLLPNVLATDASLPLSLINTVPSGIAALLELDQVPASTRLINLAGEPLTQRLVERIFARTSVPAVANLYGPTETTTYSTWVLLPRGSAFASHVGRPIANTQVYILDGRGEPVPVGVVGEIHIGGAGVARGYLNRPDLTAERFVADPFAAAAGARLYKTGDLGRWRADGCIEYLGRNDFQVKIRGFRIELGEIEAKLAAVSGVRDAVVLAREDQPGDKRLVAYVVAGGDAAITPATLRDALARELAEHMIPSAFLLLDAFPLTPNGKLDRKALPVPDAADSGPRVFVAPQTPTEQRLAAIWSRVLRVGAISRDDNFFALGGHSLLATRVVGEMARELRRPLPVRAVFDHASLQHLAAHLDEQAEQHYAAIVPLRRDSAPPLSFAQQRLWFLHQLDRAAGAAYHMPVALKLSGELDVAALRAALDRIVARHENLRTCFASVAGEPLQQIAAADSGFALERHDLTALDGAAQEQAIVQQCRDEAQAGFDLARGPLIRGRLLRLGQREHVLLVTQHHIISDGWSVGVLVRELSALYAAFRLGAADPLPPLPIQYADYAVWQRENAVLQQQLDFWRAHLAGVPTLLELPTDRPRPPLQTYAGSSIAVELPAVLVADLRALAQRHGATLFMTLLAGWSVLLARLSGQDDIVVGSPVANRQRPELESLTGFFVNTLALRVRVQAESSVSGLIEHIRQSTLDAYANQDLPFEQVVEALQPARSLSHSPLFQVMLALNNTADGAVLDLPGLRLATLPQPQATTRFDLSLTLEDRGDQVSGLLEYATDLFDAGSVQRFAERLQRVLQAMADDEAQRVATLPLLDGDERRQVLYGFNATAQDYPRDSSIPACFAAQVARTPDAIAIVCGDESLSYAALNQRANRIAHRLIAQGVRRDDCVALCAGRSVAMVVGMLAILKAGAAYLPLDPGYPAERLAHLLADSRPVALLMPSALRDSVALRDLADIPLLWLDDDSLTLQPAHDPAVLPAARDLAYVIYTSGSTGQPKGVMIEHRNVLRLVLNTSYARIGPADCVAHCANPAFDASTWEIWSALLNGARLAIVPAASVLDPAALCAALVEARVSHLWLTVGLFNEYAPRLGAALARLDTLIIGGDALDPHSVARVLAGAQRPRRLLNGYGPTETTTFATTHLIDAVADTRQAIPIGRPIANTEIYILDAQRQPVPVGVTGELYIGGDGVARGYLNRPALTAERFVDDPFRAGGEGYLYRTGDLGRWRADGCIEYAGRNDFQVKIRGFRIELGEIEACLGHCAGVRDAVVLARTDENAVKRLVAYVVAQPGLVLDVADLHGQLAVQLPDYMIPSAFVCLDALPLTANGKLDREALPAADAAAQLRRGYAAPEGDVEQALAAVWCDLLALPRAGRHDNFFELGGHSLLVMRLATRIREQFLVDIPLSAAFERPVLAAQADYIRTLQLEMFLGEELDSMQDELSSLSEAELRQILSRESVND